MSAAKKLVDMRFLRTLVPLGELGDAQLQQLMGSYSVELVASGTEIFHKGDHDAYTYYLLSGQIKLTFTDGVEKIVHSQTTQSRYILVPERPRCATAITLSTTTILKIDKGILDNIVGSKDSPGMEVEEINTGNQNDWMTHYLQSKVFLKLRAQNIQALMMRLEEVPVRAGQVIIRQNDDDGFYYIIKQGHCRVMRRNSPYEEEIEQAKLTVGTGFGEEAIISQNRRGATVSMIDDGILMRLSREDFHRILVDPLIKDVIYKDSVEIENVVYLDVRHYDDYVKDGLTDAINISLFELRSHIESLDPNKTYVAYSNHGHRAAAAAYLLCQQGLESMILRAGLDGIPVDVERGNKPLLGADNIPVVDNVISFNKSKQFVTTPRGINKPAEPSVPTSESKSFHPEQALQDPRVQALLQTASNNIQHEVEQELLADVARQKAEHEVIRLKMEAKLAKRTADQARRKAEKYAQQSAEKAEQEAREESARLRELELGAKQAEMDEAMRQVDEEAKRAQEAEVARIQAEKDNLLLKQRLDSAISDAQDEAARSAETIRQFTRQEETKQRLADQAQRDRDENINRDMEAARLNAQNEIDILKSEIESTRSSMKQQAEADAKKARKEGKASAEKIAQRKLDEIKSELQRTREHNAKKLDETRKLGEEQAQAAEQLAHASMMEEVQQISAIAEEQKARAKVAEQASQRAEVEIEKIKKDMEVARKQQHEASIVSAELARQKAIQELNEESEKTLMEKEKEISEAIGFAEECSLRARTAESARDKAIQQTQNLQGDVAHTQQQLQADISQDIARSEIEHEVARARAVELANKQAEIEEIRVHTEEVATRAKETEKAKQDAESEVNKLKAEIESFRSEHQPVTSETSNEQLQRQAEHDEEVTRKQAEIEQATKKAEQENERARLAEIAHQDAQKEILHLKTEVEIATLQATAQLESDKERSAAQQLEVELKTQALVKKQAQVISAIERAQLEKRRAKEADVARRQAERSLENYREDAEQHEKIQIEISKVRAESISKHVAMEAAAKRARKEAARAQESERARREAELEIVRLKKIATVQHRKAEKAIRKSLEVVKKPVSANKNSHKSGVAQTTKTSEPPKSAWVSDHVMWETTLGLRDDKDVAALIAPEEKQPVAETPWAEQLLTNVEIPTLQNAEPEPPSLHEQDTLLNRTKFNSREINQTLTAQLDSSDYIKRNHAVKKPVTTMIVVIAVAMLVAMYFTMSGSQRSDFNSNVMEIVSKNKRANTPSETLIIHNKSVPNMPEEVVESMEQRIEKKRKKARLSQNRKQIRQERNLRRSIKKQQKLHKQKRQLTPTNSAPLAEFSNDQREFALQESPSDQLKFNSNPVVEINIESEFEVFGNENDQENTSSNNIVPIVAPLNINEEKTDNSFSSPVKDILLDTSESDDVGAGIESSARAVKVFTTKSTPAVASEKPEVDIEDVF